jgi:aminoglycoside 6'-N-acetyltransferase
MPRSDDDALTVSKPSIAFRPLHRRDFPMLGCWLDEPLVARWWNHETSAEAIERDFGAAVDGREPTRVFVASVGGRAFGLIQRYPIAAYRDYLDELTAISAVPAAALSMDYLIGEPELRGRHLGSSMIATFAALSWAAHREARDFIVAVSVGNQASWRALERARFCRVAEGRMTPDNPRDSTDHYVYRLQRA